MRTFFEELDQGKAKLTDGIIQTEDFLHAFFATTKAALNTRRKEKIEMFAKMLNNYGAKFNEIDIDDYEENLNILDELSLKEFRMMVLHEEFYNGNDKSIQGDDKKDDVSIIAAFWSEYLKKLADEFKVTEDEIQAALIRLQRSGCYRIFSSLYGGNPDSKGCLTKRYFKIKRLVSQR